MSPNGGKYVPPNKSRIEPEKSVGCATAWHKSHSEARQQQLRTKKHQEPRGTVPAPGHANTKPRLFGGRSLQLEVRVGDDAHFRNVEPGELCLFAHADRRDLVADLEPDVRHHEAEHRHDYGIDDLHPKLRCIAVQD